MEKLQSIEICAGAGGQALGLEQAGFGHLAAIELDKAACQTLRDNRESWNVVEADLKEVSLQEYSGVDLLAGGVPCPPFSMAGKQLGKDDARDLFPDALRFVRETSPKAVMLENVRGLAGKKFEGYRAEIRKTLESSGYVVGWKVLNAAEFGVPQLRPRFILVALREEFARFFSWPEGGKKKTTVGEALEDLMAEGGWKYASNWAGKADDIAPTLVGGSKKHGGADLGPTRAKAQWLKLGVDGKGLANEPPSDEMELDHIPRLTLRMAARIQGFPDSWAFSGKKTPAYRQVGNAFPPPVACALGRSIVSALRKEELSKKKEYEGQAELFSGLA
ncbi:MAG: DNA cytosine methyltransferase [bacterium]|nr:DNA cytosine methyltransferase [bacterium]